MRFYDLHAQFFVLAHCFMECVLFLLSLLSNQILDHIWQWRTLMPFGIILCREIYCSNYLHSTILMKLMKDTCLGLIPFSQHVLAQIYHFHSIDLSLEK